MAPSLTEKRFASRVTRALRKDYPTATCALCHDSPLQLLVATILSAQCTDQRVNQVTRELFRQAPTAVELAALPLQKLEKLVMSTGFFRNKAKNIQACCQQLVDHYDGEVPRDMARLVELPGVGRKTANVVMGTAFHVPTGVVVDTHVGRIAQRLGLTRASQPEKIEQDLMELLPKKEWIDFSHRLIEHGRQICKARKPDCESCSMQNYCPRVGVSRSPT